MFENESALSVQFHHQSSRLNVHEDQSNEGSFGKMLAFQGQKGCDLGASPPMTKHGQVHMRSNGVLLNGLN